MNMCSTDLLLETGIQQISWEAPDEGLRWYHAFTLYEETCYMGKSIL